MVSYDGNEESQRSKRNYILIHGAFSVAMLNSLIIIHYIFSHKICVILPVFLVHFQKRGVAKLDKTKCVH